MSWAEKHKGVFTITTVKVDKEWCKLCILCVKLCPVKNLEFTEEGIEELGKCTGCRICEIHCPDYAIEIK